MESDIVARLRDLKNAMDECGFTGISAVTNVAADEIERLRRHYSEAEQDHVDYVAKYHHATVEIERLRERVAELEGAR